MDEFWWQVDSLEYMGKLRYLTHLVKYKNVQKRIWAALTVVSLLTTSMECRDISMFTKTEKYLKSSWQNNNVSIITVKILLHSLHIIIVNIANKNWYFLFSKSMFAQEMQAFVMANFTDPNLQYNLQQEYYFWVILNLLGNLIWLHEFQ